MEGIDRDFGCLGASFGLLCWGWVCIVVLLCICCFLGFGVGLAAVLLMGDFGVIVLFVGEV